MIESFKAALARVQTDYHFYSGCQTDPDATLAGYDLSPDERRTLSDPDLYAMIEKALAARRHAEERCSGLPTRRPLP